MATPAAPAHPATPDVPSDRPRRDHRLRRPRRGPLVIVGLFFAFAAVAHLGRRVVVLNPTSSVDPGLYLAWPGGAAVGRLVSFPVPERARPYLVARAGRLVGEEEASGWYLVKPIAAGPGNHVDTTGGRLLVEGRDLGPIYTHDGAGRPLPVWRFSGKLGPDEWLPVSRRVPGSLDGRYFGPVRSEEIEHVRRPLVRWGDGSSEGGSWRWFGGYVDEPLMVAGGRTAGESGAATSGREGNGGGSGTGSDLK